MEWNNEVTGYNISPFTKNSKEAKLHKLLFGNTYIGYKTMEQLNINSVDFES